MPSPTETVIMARKNPGRKKARRVDTGLAASTGRQVGVRRGKMGNGKKNDQFKAGRGYSHIRLPFPFPPFPPFPHDTFDHLIWLMCCTNRNSGFVTPH